MKTNTLILFAAAAAVLYVVMKQNAAQKPAKPGAPMQPPGPPTVTYQNTAGPGSQGPTLVQQFGGAPGIAEGILKIGGGIWDRLATSDDSDPDDEVIGGGDDYFGGAAST